ncbi:hypothetical protein BB560_002703 [Smittium megazygosporum]|uniref:Vacuolar protein sorting-associated protein n=1 Tax=Smittium megazygosporum TaxID=133381 RepID=A0A2T9ZE08_9FUNG|nr:hypothetical protein BB560_002703 [Smittium megazygosporum]
MLEGVVTSILNKFLGDYVDNLETKQLQLGIWKGDVTLNDLNLRKDALDGLHLPINVTSGKIGCLTLTIPWSNLTGQPVKLSIEALTLVCQLKPEKKPTKGEEIQEQLRAQVQKMKELNELEMLQLGFLNDEAQKIENSSYYGKMVAKVIDNLQITIKNIHLKYIDDQSNSDRRFSAGIVLPSLTLVSTNENWEKSFIQNMSSTIRKLVSLENLYIYWDNFTETCSDHPDLDLSDPGDILDPSRHLSIINPISGTAKLSINKQKEQEKSNINVDLEFDQFAITLDELQYHDILLLLTNFSNFQSRAKYLRFLPNPGIASEQVPRAMWKFALNCVSYEIDMRRKSWLWENIKKKCQMRRDYIRLYIISKTGATMSELDSSLLSDFENDLSFDEIKLFRQLSIPAIKKYYKKNREKKAAGASSVNKSKSSWSSSWLGWASGYSEPSTEDTETQITEDDLNDLMNALDSEDIKYDSHDFTVEGSIFTINASLRKSLLELVSVSDKKRNTILSILGENVLAHFVQLNQNMKVDLTVENFRVDDGTVVGSFFPQMVKMRQVSVSDGSNSFIPFLQVKYEQNPVDGHADSVIRLVSQSLDIVLNPAAIKEIKRFFEPPSSTVSSVQGLVDATSKSMAGLQSLTRSGVEYAIQTHKRLDLQIDFQAPVFIIPSNVTDPNEFSAILDLGHLYISSDFVSSDTVKKITGLTGDQLSKQEEIESMNLMFDWLSVKLQKTQLIVGPNFAVCNEAVVGQNTNKKLHLVDKVELNFKLGLCILNTRSANIPQIIINGHLPKLHVLFSDMKYSLLMKTLDIVSSTFSFEETSQENQIEPQEYSAIGLLDSISNSRLNNIPISVNNNDGFQPDSLNDKDFNKKTTLSDTPDSGNISPETIKALSPESVEQPNQDFSKPSKSPDNASINPRSSNSEDSDSDNDEFYDTTADIYYDKSVDNASAGDTPMSRRLTETQVELADPDQQIVKLSFKIDNLTVELFESNSDPHEHDFPLANASVSKFSLDVQNRSLDLEVGIIIHQVTIEDLLSDFSSATPCALSNPKYLMYSSSSNTSYHSSKDTNEDVDLITVNYKRTQPGHPSFQPGNDTVGQKVDIAISSIHFTLIRRTVLKLYNYILNTFANNQTTPTQGNTSAKPSIDSLNFSNDNSASTSQRNPESAKPGLSNSSTSEDNDTSGGSEATNRFAGLDISGMGLDEYNNMNLSPWLQNALKTIKVDLSLRGIDLNLCDDYGSSIALLEVSMGTASIIIASEITLDAKIGEFSLIDTHNFDSLSFSTNDYSLYLHQRKLIYINGQELLGFSFKSFEKSSTSYPGYDYSVSLNVGTMNFILAKAPIQRLMEFGKNFAIMHGLFEKARTEMSEGASQLTETVVQGSSRTKINLTLSAPVITYFNDGLMPFEINEKSKASSKNSITACLGLLSVHNEFSVFSPTLKHSVEINSFYITLENVRISSDFFYITKDSPTHNDQTLDILENVTLSAEVDIALRGRNSQSLLPETKVVSSVDKLAINLTSQQYCFIMNMLNGVTSIFNSESFDSHALGLHFEENAVPQSILNLLSSEGNTTLIKSPATTSGGNVQQGKPSKGDSLKSRTVDVPQLDLILSLPKVQMELFDCNFDEFVDLENSSFTRIDLFDLSVKYRMKFDNSSILEISLNSVDAFDTRAHSKNYYTQFIGIKEKITELKAEGDNDNDSDRHEVKDTFETSTETVPDDAAEPKESFKLSTSTGTNSASNDSANPPQFLIQFDMEPTEPTVIRGTIDSPKLIFEPDHVLQQIKFFTLPFLSNNAPPQNTEISINVDNEDSANTKNPNVPFILKVKIKTPELIIFADPTDASSQALVLSIDELCISLHQIYSFRISEMDMILCRIDQRSTSSRSIVDPVTIKASIAMTPSTKPDSVSIDGNAVSGMDIKVDVSKLVFRFGIKEMTIMQLVVNQINHLISKALPKSDQTDKTPKTSPQADSAIFDSGSYSSQKIKGTEDAELNSPKISTENLPPVSFNKESSPGDSIVEKMNVNVDGIQAILIHDKLDIPVLNLSIKKFLITASNWSSNLYGNSDVVLTAMFFNFYNTHWEPIIEPWNFNVNVCHMGFDSPDPKFDKILKEATRDALKITLSSNERINIDIAHSGIRCLLIPYLNKEIFDETDFTKDNSDESSSPSPNAQPKSKDSLLESVLKADPSAFESKPFSSTEKLNKTKSTVSAKDPPLNEGLNLLRNSSLRMSKVSVKNELPTRDTTQPVHTKGKKDPYIIHNKTGLDCYIWVDLPQGSSGSNYEHLKPVLLKNGDSMPWSFMTSKALRESLGNSLTQLGIQFTNGLWEWVRRVEVGMEDVKYYKLSPAVDGTTYLLAVEVSLDYKKLINNVVLRSPLVVENKTVIPVEMCMVDYRGKLRSDITKIQPGEKFPVSLLLCDQYAIKVRPESAFGYKWSEQFIYWRDFLSPNKENVLTCTPVSMLATSIPHFNLNFSSTFDNSQGKVFKYPIMKLTISSPLEVQNLLPFSIQFRVLDNTDGTNWSNVLPSGEISSVHSVKLNHLVLMSIRIPDANLDKCDGCVIETSNSDDYPVEPEIVMYDRHENKLSLKIQRSVISATRGSYLRVSIVAPYVLVNRTGLPIEFKSLSLLRSSTMVAGQQDAHFQSQIFETVEQETKGILEQSQKLFNDKLHFLRSIASSKGDDDPEKASDALAPNIAYKDQLSWGSVVSIGNKIKPVMFSYGGFDIRNRVMFKAGLSEWSKHISLDVIGYVDEVIIQLKAPPRFSDSKSLFRSLSLSSSASKPSKKYNLHLGMSIKPGHGKFVNTNFVVFSPRYIVKNNTNLPLFIKEVGSDNMKSLVPGQKAPFHYLLDSQNNKMCISVNIDSIRETLSLAGIALRNKESERSWNNTWSSPFFMNQIGKVFIRLPKPQSLAIYEAAPPNSAEGKDFAATPEKLTSVPLELTTILFSISVFMESEVIFISINRENGEWPFRIDNWTGFDILFWQSNPNQALDHPELTRATAINESTNKVSTFNSSNSKFNQEVGSGDKDNLSESFVVRKYTVLGYHSMPYTWDYLDVPSKNIILSLFGQTHKIPLQEAGFRTSFYINLDNFGLNKSVRKNRFIISVEMITQGSQQVLKIVSNDLKAKYAVQKSTLTESLSKVSIQEPRSSLELNDYSLVKKSGNLKPKDSITPSSIEGNIYAQNSGTRSSPDSESTDSIDPDDIPNFIFEISMVEGIGISLVNKDIVEILYVTLEGLNFKIQDSLKTRVYTLQIQWVQIDNQLYGAVFPTILFPSLVPRKQSVPDSSSVKSVKSSSSSSSESNMRKGLKPVFQLAAIRSKNENFADSYKNNYVSHSEDSQVIRRYKYVSLLLQELSVQLDEDLLEALMSFISFDIMIGDNSTAAVNAALKNDLMTLLAQNFETWYNSIRIDTIFNSPSFSVNDIPKIDIQYLTDISSILKLSGIIPIFNYIPEVPERFHFDLLILQPIKLNISFSRTAQLTNSSFSVGSSTEDAKVYRSNPLEYLFNILTMVLGNVNEVPIYLDALILENAHVSIPDLNDRLSKFYTSQFTSQLYRFVGGANVLGNPVGLFNTISSGVADIFYEPYQGIMMSDRPQDFGYGLAKGTASFFKKTVYGVSDSMSRFTDSIGKGFSAATLDEDFQSKRRMFRLQNKSDNAFRGFSHGAESFAKSITSGLTGVVTKPIHGAEKEGIGGFFSGVGKGIVGAVTKPFVGLFDLASNISEGIKNTTVAFDSTNIVRSRLPRPVNALKILENYNANEAVGFNWMRELNSGKYAYDYYLAYLELENSNLVVLVTYQNIVMFKILKRYSNKNTSSGKTPKISSKHATVEWETSVKDIKSAFLETGGITIQLLSERTSDSLIDVSIPTASNRESQISLVSTASRSSKASHKRSGVKGREDISSTPGFFIPISNQQRKKWFYNKIEEAIKASKSDI